MKNRAFLTALMLISLPLFFGLHVRAQGTRDIRPDIYVTINPRYGSTDPGSIYGTVTNNSPNPYPCVRIEFKLGTRYDMERPGEPTRILGTTTLVLQNVQPRAVREYEKALPMMAAAGLNSITECTPQEGSQSVILYDNPNFEGRSKSFGVGKHTLSPAVGFNDLASSIRVSAGLVAIVYEHADEGGGYGLWVDFLEDQPNLAKYNFDNKISHLFVFKSRDHDSVWVRNSIENGAFREGYWRVLGRRRPPFNPDPLIGPAKPPNVRQPPPPPAVCTISGEVTNDKMQYRTRIKLYRPDNSDTQISVAVRGGRYTLTNVPAGAYEVRGTGNYPTRMGPRGSEGLGIFADGDQRVTCRPNGSITVNFDVHSTEG
jgi:hypothetical protein